MMQKSKEETIWAPTTLPLFKDDRAHDIRKKDSFRKREKSHRYGGFPSTWKEKKTTSPKELTVVKYNHDAKKHRRKQFGHHRLFNYPKMTALITLERKILPKTRSKRSLLVIV